MLIEYSACPIQYLNSHSLLSNFSGRYVTPHALPLTRYPSRVTPHALSLTRYHSLVILLSSFSGHYDVVKLLLEHTSNIEHHNKAGCTPLMLAAREGHYEVTFLLLEYNAEIDTPSGSNDDTPLTLSCWKVGLMAGGTVMREIIQSCIYPILSESM